MVISYTLGNRLHAFQDGEGRPAHINSAIMPNCYALVLSRSRRRQPEAARSAAAECVFRYVSQQTPEQTDGEEFRSVTTALERRVVEWSSKREVP